MKNYYTVQIIPDESTKTHSYRISKLLVKLFVWLICVLVVLLAACVWKLSEINIMLISARKYKIENVQLKKLHAEYEVAFQKLDSIYFLENQIQNIFETYLENDTDKINSILEKNRLIFSDFNEEVISTDVEYYANLIRQNTNSFPNILPVIGVIIQHYSEKHKGVDFTTAMNEPVYATAGGVIVFAGDKGDLGLTVEIDHGQKIISRYAHLSRHSVKVGSTIRKGEVIGTVGNTGNSSGYHLHYEIIINGEYVNPENYF